MSKYVCGRCYQGFDDLQLFGDHACHNPVVIALVNVIKLSEYPIDLRKTVEEAVENHRVKKTVKGLEDALKRGDLSA